jgi:hypothetical protein
MAPLVISSLKSLEDHLFRSKDFTHTMGNISKVFQLSTTEKEVVEEVLQKSLQEVADLKGHMQQLQIANQ